MCRTTINRGKILTRILNRKSNRMNWDLTILMEESQALESVQGSTISWSDFREVMEGEANKLDKNLDARIARVTERILVDMMEIIGENQSMSFVENTLRRDIRGMLALIMKQMGCRKALRLRSYRWKPVK